MNIRQNGSKITAVCAIVLACTAFHIHAATLYVNGMNPTPSAPFTSWATAATNIQNAVDAAAVGDTVLVTNGIYNTGSKVTPGYACLNRVVITNNIRVESVNGPQATLIVGAEASGGGNGTNAVRGVYMSAGLLSGFTVANGHTRTDWNSDHDVSGGGINLYGGSGVVSNCVLTGNSAVYGGGSYHGKLYNCTLTGNSAVYGGGGSYYGTLYSCTLTGNSVSDWGGGCAYSTLYNCIVYFNRASFSGENGFNSTFAYSCTVPHPGGTGNITNAPMLVSASHLHADSPCIGAGSATYSSGTDIDGEAWRSPPSMGCDEPSAPMTGALTVSVSAKYGKVVPGYNLHFSAVITGEVSSNRWTFEDETLVLNAAYVERVWASTGTYEVVLTAWNDDYPSGISATAQVEVVEANYYVDAGNLSPAVPYTNWATAATNIQDAVDEARIIPGSTVWVADGIYNSGSRVFPQSACLNRLVIADNIRVQSVNGPQTTFIVGAEASGGGNGTNAVRGVYMSAGLLAGFTITNGHTGNFASGALWHDCNGGGISFSGSGMASNCVLTGNLASQWGGGSCYGTLYNCTLSGNSACQGGGSCQGKLYNCTSIGNSASYGGGSYQGALKNCIVYSNSATVSGSNWYRSSFSYSCTAPLPAGAGNISSDPLFIDSTNANYRLSSASPCINAGHNSYCSATTDLDGNPRVIGGVVDMGAYERQEAGTDVDGDNMADAWEMNNFGSRYSAQPNTICSNGVNTLLEAYIAGLNPNDPQSRLLISDLRSLTSGNVINWNAVTGRLYNVYWTTNLLNSFQPLYTNYTGGAVTDTLHSAAGKCFYKLEVRLP